MIPSIHSAGRRTIGLLHYLYGPGTHEEHTDPHLVASFDAMSPDPGRDARATLRDLQQLLDQPVQALPSHARPARHVWHTSVRATADDRILTDEEWGQVARRIVAATGIDPGGGTPGCRWAAVRHADDHIHIVATTVCEDGSHPDDWRSGKRAQAECRLLEAELGLAQVAPGDGTAAQRPTSAERHKAVRQGRDRTAREELRETVRRAAAGAAGEDEFFARLAAAGLLTRQRVAPSGDLLGYKVALPGDHNKQGEPVFYPGARLAPDLSLPRLRQRWEDDTPPGPEESSRAPGGPAGARRRTATVGWAAVAVINHGEDALAAGAIAATAEVLDAIALTSAAHTRKALREAARAFERASRSHVQAAQGHHRALRQAARDLIHSGPALGHREEGEAGAMVIDMLFFLVSAAAHWHARTNHAQQAAAARQAATHLQTAYRPAAAQPLHILRERGRQLDPAVRQQQATVVRQAVPQLAERILAEPGWNALAITLLDAAKAGHEPAPLLRDVAAYRELDSADSLCDVLVWRLRRAAELPTSTTDRSSTRQRPDHDIRHTDQPMHSRPRG